MFTKSIHLSWIFSVDSIHKNWFTNQTRLVSQTVQLTDPNSSWRICWQQTDYQWMMTSFSVSDKLACFKLRVFVLYNKYIEGLLICRLSHWLIITTFKIKVGNADISWQRPNLITATVSKLRAAPGNASNLKQLATLIYFKPVKCKGKCKNRFP